MNGAVPPLRTVGSTFYQQCSRIPHLRLHILHHRTHATPVSRKATQLHVQHQRFQHTFSGVQSFGHAEIQLRSEDDAADVARQAARPKGRSDATASGNATTAADEAATASKGGHAATFEKHPANFYEILQQGHPERILFALGDTKIGTAFINDADDEMFVRAFCSIDPDYFLGEHKSVYRELHPSMHQEGVPRFSYPMEVRLKEMLAKLDDIMIGRISAGHALGLPIYRHLLSCAEATGDGKVAANVFEELMPQHGVTPDLQCYNSFLGALIWSNAYGHKERYHLRVTGQIRNIRSKIHRPNFFAGHRTAHSYYGHRAEFGIRFNVLRVFRELVKLGISANETTFTHVMVAMGKEGDIAGVKSILKSVWNIDVDLLEKYDEEEIESPTFYEEGSPLRPTKKLLSAMVHIFGSNSDLSLASSVLDYVSRNYNLPVPDEVWTQLLEWAYVLSTRRSGNASKAGLDDGILDRSIVERIFSLITDEPYNVQPTVRMFAMRIRIKESRGLESELSQALDLLRQSTQLLDEHRTNLAVVHDKMLGLVKNLDKVSDWDGFFSADFLDRRRKFILLSLKADADLSRIIHSVRRIFEFPKWENQAEFASRTLPDMVQEFAVWLPPSLKYYTPTGHVVLNCKSHVREAVQSANSGQLLHTASLRTVLDTPLGDHGRLFEHVRRAIKNWRFGRALHTELQYPNATVLTTGEVQAMRSVELTADSTAEEPLSLFRTIGTAPVRSVKAELALPPIRAIKSIPPMVRTVESRRDSAGKHHRQ